MVIWSLKLSLKNLQINEKLPKKTKEMHYLRYVVQLKAIKDTIFNSAFGEIVLESGTSKV